MAYLNVADGSIQSMIHVAPNVLLARRETVAFNSDGSRVWRIFMKPGQKMNTLFSLHYDLGSKQFLLAQQKYTSWVVGGRM